MKLPLIDYTSDLFKKTDFENVLIIAVQHILDSTYSMFESLFDMGIKPQNTFLLGKCYSTNKEIMKKFNKKGVNVSEGSAKFDSHITFDKQFELEIKKFLKSIQKKINFKDYKKILLVDDGGHLIDIGNYFFKKLSNIVAVEQTSSGYNKLKEKKLSFPIINVARSNAKLVYETPFIAESIVDKLFFKLKKLKLKPKTCLIIGAGAVGQGIFNLLKNKFQTHIYDIKHHISDFGKIELSDIISDFELIIGASGNKITNNNFYKKIKKGTILVSTSSSDREFSAITLRKKITQTNDCHKDIFVNNIWLLNCGFPLNFDGKKNSAPPEKIQLTLSLMLSAICLATRKKYQKDFIELEPTYQKLIVEEFNKIESKSK
ncbi:MAG: NAD(P)-dependent oxidoreductase [Patescibacteria group bacterium]|nr:NAD(P)-dependent oxidoreductase [Patescibacteria group bacterium]